jgi:hypothetical protein
MSVSLKALRDADARCLDAAELVLDALDDLPSPLAFRHLISELTRGRSLARSSEPASPFETLAVRHLEASWELLEQVARYRFEWPSISAVSLLDTLAGAGALDRLESVLAASDPRDVLGHLELRHGFRAKRLSADAPDVRPLLERTTEQLGRAFRSWLASYEGSLPGTDAEIVLAPSSADRAWYEPARHRIVLTPGEYTVFREGDRLRASPVAVARSLARELAGHAVQNALSRDLPEFLQPDHRARMRFAALPLAEGFADHRAALAVPFLEAHVAEFELSERDLELARQMTRFAFFHHALSACLGALAIRSHQEPGFDPVAYLAERVGHSGFGEQVALAGLDTLDRLLHAAACVFGLELVQQTAAELAEEGIEGAEAVSRLGWGGWAYPCYREAVLGEEQEAG